MKCRIVSVAVALLLPIVNFTNAAAQGQTGTITGRVVDDEGAPVVGAQVFISQSVGTSTRANGQYVLNRVPSGSQTLRARFLGLRPEAATINVAANQTVTHDFTLRRDPLQLQTMVVTGTQTPRMNLDASVAVTTLTATEVQAAAPRSTTEMLRYVPGFTRVESSGGEVNENISMRGILGVEYVAFLEDGLPVFPTMHTFFMNADNLFRFDTNIERLEVVRGGSSPLFGSNTPGAIVNFINKSGGDVFGGTMRATGATKGLARYDLNMNGPFGDDWRFNVGGFYRYDHGVRDPGFPGIRGGQIKGNVTRLFDKGYLRISAKYIDDRNQFILPLPLTNPDNPEYVQGFSNYGAMSTPEGLDIRVPTPNGTLTLPLDNGLRTQATWFTADVSLDLSENWHLQNTAQVMQDDQEWNALLPGQLVAAADYATTAAGSGGLGLPAGSTVDLFYLNVRDAAGNQLPFSTPNGLLSPSDEWHVEKPISAVQNQLSLRRSFGRHALTMGAYLANYSQDNRWFFTQILTDVADNQHFLEAVAHPAGGGTINVTKNGFRKFMSDYKNGSGQATIASGVVGGEVQLTDQLRADLGVRVEYNTFVQSAENTAQFDLDGDPANTPYDNEKFGNNSFRHFTKGITDWSSSVGLNYRFNDNVSFYGTAARGYKMPALDEFLNATNQAQVDIFESREVQSGEVGVKYATGRVGVTVNGFYTKLKNITGQGAIFNATTGQTEWRITTDPENRSFGAEVEAFVSPVEGLQLVGSGTIMQAELGAGRPDTMINGAPLTSTILGIAPATIGNLAAFYSPQSVAGLQFKADWHWVGSRWPQRPQERFTDFKLPSYNYFNLGAGYAIPAAGVRINADLLNAFQSKGLEEGNPRLIGGGLSTTFLARPLLPRRFQLSLEYEFGQAGPSR
ncbi:MAG TPA: TonB-dependent receptor [Gemmatimonadales bacterium]|jgi:outer membrane receptor protein involved in Fe transport|nr:TonB-dependent receptor [Gemmatimonadales bacterium]